MLTIFALLLVTPIIVFWNTESYINKNNELPRVRALFCIHINEADRRAFIFLVTIDVIFMLISIYWLYSASIQEVLEDLSKAGFDLLKAVTFASIMFNYLVRLAILRRNDFEMNEGDAIRHWRNYIWDAWLVRKGATMTSREAKLLRRSNLIVAALILSLFAYHYIK